MKIIGQKTYCHICSAFALCELEKCKLDCDGLEQDFCRDCSALYRSFRLNFGKLLGNESFEALKQRRAKAGLRLAESRSGFSICSLATGITIEDEGPYLEWCLDAEGDSLWDLLENASLTQVDQDGGDHRTQALSEFSEPNYSTIERMVAREYLKQVEKAEGGKS